MPPLPPGFSCFLDPGRPNALLWLRLAADLETPVSIMLKLAAAEPWSFLLESVTGGAVRARYSVVGMKPDLIWRIHRRRAHINRNALADPHDFRDAEAPPLESLRALIAESRLVFPSELPPMAAGLFGALGYDIVRLAEHLPAPNPDPLALPDAILLRPSLVAIHDVVTDTLTLATPIWGGKAEDGAAQAFTEAVTRLEEARAKLARATSRTGGQLLPAAGGDRKTPPPDAPAAQSNMSRTQFLSMVRRARDYIGQGEIFQVVPSQRWHAPCSASAFSLYRALRRENPSPYMFYFNFGAFQLVGASPEILVRLKENRISLRPLAGTRPRGKTEEEDRALERALLADPKERAEHLMLLDLGRNDVGRVAKIGTVNPNQRFAVERYSHVMHIVSNIEGERDPRHDALSVLLSALPAGTLSGAPKIRAMEIIDELEPVKRGIAYAGAAGYFSASGDMDNCIILRTALVKDGVMYVQSGAGIVWDSEPKREYDETCQKAQALFRAAAIATMFEG